MFTWGIAWSHELCKIWDVMLALPKSSSLSDIMLCHWTNSSHVSKDHSAIEKS